MKKIAKILLIILGGMLLAIIVLPIAFRGQIEGKVKTVINENLNATVNWDKFSLSMIRNFPNLGIGLNGFTVINHAPFEGDTLLKVGRFNLAVDLMKAIRGGVIDIKSIMVDSPEVHLMVNSDSIANWDILPIANDTVEAPQDTAPAAYNVALRSLELREANLSFVDATMGFGTALRGFGAKVNGDFTAARTRIALQARVDTFDLIMDGIQYVRNAPVDLRANIDADLENMIFRMEENELNFSGLPMFFEGFVDMLDNGYELDVKLGTRATDFKTLLALVPEAFLKDFDGLRAQGTMLLEATAKGVFVDSDNLPAFNLALRVDDGQIQYPGLPKSIDAINVRMLVQNPGGSLDNTVVDVSNFSLSIDNNPFNASVIVSRPISNPTFRGAMNGTVNLNSIVAALPMDSVLMGGVITMDLKLAGDYNLIENQMYESIQADGTIAMEDFSFVAPAFPTGIKIPTANLFFSPRFMELRAFESVVGESDFNLTGRLENYLAYIFQDGVLKGRLDHESNFINTNQLMGMAGTQEEDTVVVEEPFGKLLIPANLSFFVTTTIDSLLYDRLTLTNVTGNLQISDASVKLTNLRTNLLNGAMVLNGEYNTRDTLNPFVDFNLGIETIDINKAAHSFSMVESFLPVARNAAGRISSTLSFRSVIGEGLSPVLSSFNGRGSLKSQNLEVAGTRAQTALVSMLNDERYKIAGIRDLLVNFNIQNGNLVVSPFYVEVFGKRANISGTQSLDQSMNYLITMPVSREELGSMTAGLLSGVLPPGGQDVMVGINITGKPTDPKLALDVRDLRATIREEARARVQAEAERAVDKAIEEVGRQVVDEVIQNQEVKEQIDEGLRRLRDRLR